MANGLAGAVDDYSQLKNAYPGLNKFLEMLGHNVDQQVPTQQDYQDPNKMQEWATNSALNAPALGTLKYKTDLAEGMTKLPNAMDLIKSILHFDRSIINDGKAMYVNPKDKAEKYTLNANNPNHPLITGAWAGESKGSGGLNKKLYAMMVNENLLRHNPDKVIKPSHIGVNDIVEENTLKGIVNGTIDDSGRITDDALLKTLWGHSIDRIAQMYGGKADPIKMSPTYEFSNINHPMTEAGIDPHNLFDVLSFAKKNNPRYVYRQHDIYNGVKFDAPIKYPSK